MCCCADGIPMFLRIWQPRKFEPGPLNLGRFQPYLNVLALTFMAVIAVRHLLVLLLLIFKYIIGKPKARGHRAYTQGMEPPAAAVRILPYTLTHRISKHALPARIPSCLQMLCSKFKYKTHSDLSGRCNIFASGAAGLFPLCFVYIRLQDSFRLFWPSIICLQVVLQDSAPCAHK